MIAYGFPPEGMAGSFRPLRFVRHLPSVGWHPTVITAEKRQYGRYDPGLLSLVPEEVEVVRVAGEDVWQRIQAWRARRSQGQRSGVCPERLVEIREPRHSSVRSYIRNIARMVEGCCYHPDWRMPWIKPAVTSTVKTCQRIRPRVIWVTGGPWSSFVVARDVSLQTDVPYVLDFRDSWTMASYPFEANRPEWAKRWDRRILFQLLKEAQAVTFRYHSEAECYWRAYPEALDPSRIHIIPNGFEGAIDEFRVPAGNKCRILYTGALSPYRYDTLLKSLSLLRKTDPNV